MKRFFHKVLIALWILILCFSLIFILTEKWLIRSWASMSADELIFHLSSSLKGANMDVVRRLVLFYYFPGIVLLGIIFCLFFFSKKDAFRKTIYNFSFIAALVLLFLSLKDLEDSTGLISRIVPLSVGRGGEDDFIADNYTDAADVTFTFPENKRNLIYIYLESMEITFSDNENGGAFPVDIIPNLSSVALKNEDFRGNSLLLNGAYSLPSTDWTMAGMFAQSSGMPLKVAVKTDYEELGFFPNLITLGDVLHDAGYVQTLLIGSEAEFGGRANFYTTHGDFDLHDYKYAIQNGWIPEDYNVWWGFEDSKLFEFAKEDLTELSENDEPFHYVILTADTHFEDGYVCELCGNEHDDQYANVFSCSDRQVYHFLEWLMEQDFWDDTTVVLCGDHTTMDSDFCDNVPLDYGRRTYTVIINGLAEPVDASRTRIYSTLDMFPTTLAAIGVEMSSDRLGLGVNLYSDTPTIIEEYGLDYCRDRLTEKSDFMVELSGEHKDSIQESFDETVIRMAFVEDGEELSLFMWGFGNLNLQYMDDMYVEVEDTRTGEVVRYEMIIDLAVDPNPYGCTVVIDNSVEDLQYLEATGYMCFNGSQPKEVVRISGMD